MRLLYGLAAVAYLAMLAAFFRLNDPVNSAVARWTPQTLPADWPRYRGMWEAGHVLAFAFGLVALAATAKALRHRRGDQSVGPGS